MKAQTCQDIADLHGLVHFNHGEQGGFEAKTWLGTEFHGLYGVPAELQEAKEGSLGKTFTPDGIGLSGFIVRFDKG